VKKALQLALGIITSVGGFFDIGNLVTTMQAGAVFRFRLLWSLLLGTIIVIFLIEMSGRFAAVTKKALPEAIREHFGFKLWLVPFVVMVLLHLATLAAEIGGMSFALQLLTGITYRVWAIPVGILVWLFLWRTTFSAVEYSVALLGMITLAFVVGAVAHHPPRGELVAGLLPSLPTDDGAKYWFFALSIIGALIAPYLFYFYSSGAIEDEWDTSYLWVNRGVSLIGMTFGAVISAGSLIVAAMVFQPRGIAVESLNQAAPMLTEAFPFWGYALFAICLGIACLGAALEVSLSLAYMTAQTFGWKWGESVSPWAGARFATVYTVGILLASLVMVTGLDPVKVTIYTMAMNAAVLPVVALPFLVLMNDKRLLGAHANGIISNSVAAGVVLLAFVLAAVSLPLLITGA
jgi:Mn2+/Fe2+ NRAMP family transporter